MDGVSDNLTPKTSSVSNRFENSNSSKSESGSINNNIVVFTSRFSPGDKTTPKSGHIGGRRSVKEFLSKKTSVSEHFKHQREIINEKRHADLMRLSEEGGDEGVEEVKEKDGGGWTEVSGGRSQRILHNVDKKVAIFETRWRRSSFRSHFEAVDDSNEVIKDGFEGCNMLKLHVELRKKIPSATITKDKERGQMVVTVDSEEEVSEVHKLGQLGEICVRLVTAGGGLWRRIRGVPTDVEEEEMLEVLKDCGVMEVKREKFYVTETKDNKEVKVERRSSRVRLRFGSVPLNVVDLGFSEKFPVTMCFDSVMQCWCCNQFNHKATECSRRNNPLCRRCGVAGHQAWQCKSPPRCINCRRPHSARDPTCEVLLKYAEAYKVRQVSRIVATYPGVRVTAISHPPLPGEASSVSNAPEGGMTYAGAVSGVNFTQAGETRCRIPVGSFREPAKPQGAPVTQARRETKGNTKPKTGSSGLVAKLWKQIKKCVEPLAGQYPMLAMLIPIVEACIQSQEMTKIISQVFTSSILNDDQ